MMNLEELPCWGCLRPEAADVKHMLAIGALHEARNKSPSGLPLCCCKISFAGMAPAASVPALSDTRRP
jgi:hypothetical protein